MTSAMTAPSGPRKKQKLDRERLFLHTATGIISMLMLHSCSGSSPHQLNPPISAVISLKLKDLVIASPDVGGAKRAKSYAKYLDCPLVLCNKTRARANVVSEMQIIGDVQGKDVVIVDDMVDTAGTITKAADIMKEAGAKTVRACASHCVMSGPASERVQNSALEEIIFTDSIPYSNRCAKVKQLSVADMFAETIRRCINNESISSQYII